LITGFIQGMRYDGQRMDTLPLWSVNHILNGLNINNDIVVVAGHNVQALVTRVSATSCIPEYKLEIQPHFLSLQQPLLTGICRCCEGWRIRRSCFRWRQVLKFTLLL